MNIFDKKRILALRYNTGIQVINRIENPVGAFTIEFWQKLTAAQLDFEFDAEGRKLHLIKADGHLRYLAGDKEISIDASAVAEGWHHYALTYDSSLAQDQAKLYLDGVLAASGNQSAHQLVPIRIINLFPSSAGKSDTGGELLVGWLACWTRARTAAEIVEGHCVGPSVNDRGLLGYWPLDDGGREESKSALPGVRPAYIDIEAHWLPSKGQLPTPPSRHHRGERERMMMRVKQHIVRTAADQHAKNAQKIASAREAAHQQLQHAHERAAKTIELGKFERIYYLDGGKICWRGSDGAVGSNPNRDYADITVDALNQLFYTVSLAQPYPIQVFNTDVPSQPVGHTQAVDAPISSLVCDGARHQLHWVETNGKIHTYNNDSGRLAQTLDASTAANSDDWRLDVDMQSGWLYWSNSKGIWTNGQENGGGNPALIAAGRHVSGNAPIAASGDAGGVFWLDHAERAIKHTDPGGTKVQTVYAMDGLGDAITTDSTAKRIYWLEDRPLSPPISIWRADIQGDQLIDAVGGRHGTVHGKVKVVKAEKINQPALVSALRFDGKTQFVDIPYDPAVNTPHFSLSAWVRPTIADSTHRAAFASRDDYPQCGYTLYVGTANNWQLWLGNKTGGFFGVLGDDTMVGQWQHLVMTFDGKYAAVYQNGALIQRASVDIALNLHRPFRIGAGACELMPPKYYFMGDIAEISYWNRALSEYEVTNGLRATSRRYLMAGSFDGKTPPKQLMELDGERRLALLSKGIAEHERLLTAQEQRVEAKKRHTEALIKAHERGNGRKQDARNRLVAAHGEHDRRIVDAQNSARIQRAAKHRELMAHKNDAHARVTAAQAAANTKKANARAQAQSHLDQAHGRAKDMKRKAQDNLDRARNERAKHT